MISYINIKNIALIQELSIELKHGLNILSGETGAGKSIIIDSINFVLGDRADRTLIRHGENMARVEVVFSDLSNFDGVKEILEEAGIDCDDDVVIVNRLMTQDRSECRINNRLVNLSTLRSVVSLLVDIHSQAEHQSLMKVANHITLLDAYSSKIDGILEQYRQKWSLYKQISENLKGFATLEERERKIDILQYQIEEIERINYIENEEDGLLSDRNRFYNAQKIGTALNFAYENIDGTNNIGGIPSLKSALVQLASIAEYDTDIATLVDRLEGTVIELEDISATISDKTFGGGFDSIDIDAIENRIKEIKNLQKKYGKTAQEINDFYLNIKNQMDDLQNAEEKIASLTKEQSKLGQEIEKLVLNLNAERKQTASKFEKAIQSNLMQLGMKDAIFEVNIVLSEDILANLHANGADYVEFMLSPNIGEPLKPLAKIASGGEMSRFMLALKNVTAQLDNIDTLIFDEIDTGISGVIAKVVACKLYDIATSRQVIAITHLPQLSSMADINFLIEKNTINQKTLTSIKELDPQQTLQEIMRLSGFSTESKVGLDGAKEMKNWANLYKKSKNN